MIDPGGQVAVVTGRLTGRLPRSTTHAFHTGDTLVVDGGHTRC